MKQENQKSQSTNLLQSAGSFFLVLLLVLAAGSIAAQQSAPITQAPAAQAGAPAMGFRPAVAVAPATPGFQAAATAPGPRLEPITGAPISSLATRPTAQEGAAEQEAANDVGMLASDGSIHQGMKVHGHWVINVSNPDGTQVQHREFENSLESSAQGFMVGLLSGYLVPGDWMIVAGAQSGASACLGPSFGFCGLVHNPATDPAQGYCGVYYCTGSTLNYTYNFGSSFNGPFSIVLSGSITANQTGTIGTVYTLLNTCANIAYSNTASPGSIETSSPATCVTQTTPATWFGPFTDANIAPVAVTSGQLIQIIVTITFS